MTLKILSIVLFIVTPIYGRIELEPCRSDYFYSETGFGWYKLHTELQSFEAAQKTCIEEGTQLASVTPTLPWVKEVVKDILTKNNIEEIYTKSYNVDLLSELGGDSTETCNVFNLVSGPKFDKTEPRAFVCQFFGPKSAFKACSNVPEFRWDYTYSEPAKGWLKFHSVPATFNDARLRCHLEGAILASPISNDLASAMMIAAKTNGDKNFLTGINAFFSKGDFFSIEGVPLSAIPVIKEAPEFDNFHDEESCITMSVEGKLRDVPCGNTYNYICYKKQTPNITRQNECGTYDPEYRLESETGSCYKFHPEPRTWSRAYMTCAAEGGHLAIINSEKEAQVLSRIFSAVPKKSMRPISGLYFASVGFHDWGEHGSWLTIHGQTLQDAGYAKWVKGEPNNQTHTGGAGEYCGSINLAAELNDLYCEDPVAFICEKKPKKQ